MSTQLKPYLKEIADTLRKNLYNPNVYDAETYPLVADNVLYASGGFFPSNNRGVTCATPDYIPCVDMRGKTYTINYGYGYSAGMCFYGEDKSYLSGLQYMDDTHPSPFTFTVPDDAYYFRFTASQEHIEEIKIEEGPLATKYIPYGYHEIYNAQNFTDKINEVYDKAISDNWDSFCAYDLSGGNFSGQFWNDFTFRPTKNLSWRPRNSAAYSFQFNNISNIKKRLEECGVVLDLSNASRINNSFVSLSTEELPELNISGVTAAGYLNAFVESCPNLTRIDKIILPTSYPNGTTGSVRMLTGCPKLTDVTFEGLICFNLSFGTDTPLSPNSMKSIIDCLKDFSVEKPYAYTITFTSGCWEALEASGKPFDDGITEDDTMTWQDYVSMVLGWNT